MPQVRGKGKVVPCYVVQNLLHLNRMHLMAYGAHAPASVRQLFTVLSRLRLVGQTWSCCLIHPLRLGTPAPQPLCLTLHLLLAHTAARNTAPLLQLIVHLGVPADDPTAPDWGTIAVYSCSASCSSGVTPGASPPEESAYLEEFVWVQGPV